MAQNETLRTDVAGSQCESGNADIIVWKKESILAAWRAFNKASDNPMRAALNAAIKTECLEELDTSGFYEEGYSQAVDDCVGMLRNWIASDDNVRAELGAVTKSILAMKRDG